VEEPAFEIQSRGDASVFYKSHHWKRLGSTRRWYKVSYDGRQRTFRNITDARLEALFEEMYQGRRDVKYVQRFPRLGNKEESTDLEAIPTISQITRNTSSWLIEGLILQGTINLLTAPPGGFKTWLALWIGGCVSEGTECLGHKTVETEVLYLDRENPPSVISERRDVLNLDSKLFHVWGHWWEHDPPKIDDPRLLEIARSHRLLIVFDPFVRFHSADENSARQMARVLRHLRRLADAGATILLLHHQAKAQNSQYRGSTDILAGVDAAFELRTEKSKKGDQILGLRCFKHRSIPETTTTIRLNLEKGCFEVVDDSSNAISADVVEKIQAVIALNHRITQKELLQKAGLPETSGRRILQQADGVHWVSKHGHGKTLHYSLKD
jgi:hypothetical protein